jgi:hypothetical protein
MADINTIDPNYTDFSGRSNKATIEFDKLFTSEKRKGGSFVDQLELLDKKTQYTLYSLSKPALAFAQRVYMQLPFYARALKIKQGLVINKGVVYADASKQEKAQKKESQEAKELSEFQKSFGGTEFLIELVRLIETKGNAIVSFVAVSETENRFIIFHPNNFFVITSSSDTSIAQYNIAGYGYKKQNTYITLNPATTIPVWTTPKSVLGIPSCIIEQDLSLAILSETEEYKTIKQMKGFVKTLLSVYTTENGNKKMATDAETVEVANILKKLVSDPTQAAHAINKEVTTTILPTIDTDTKFYENLEAKAMVAANMAGIPAQMLMSGKNINRTNADQAYKTKIQSNIQPMNDILSGVIQKMAEIWSTSTTDQKTNPKLEVTIDNPKANLDIDMDVKDILECVKTGIITAEEAKKLLNLNN